MTEPLDVLIAEDEVVVARRVARITASILGPMLGELAVEADVDAARRRIERRPPHVLVLDLALGGGPDGFSLLEEASARAFDTIVVSAHAERALEAFEHGVRDFVAKPFTRERLERAFERVLQPAARVATPAAWLGVRRRGGVDLVAVDRLLYIRGAGTRSRLVLAGGEVRVHDKMLDRLEGMLPERFERIHKSYIVDLARVRRLVTREGSRYAVLLEDGTELPVGRTRVARLRNRVA